MEPTSSNLIQVIIIYELEHWKRIQNGTEYGYFKTVFRRLAEIF